MKKLITILLVLICFKSYSQFDLGSFFKRNKYKTKVIYKSNDTIQGYSLDFKGTKFYFNENKKGKFKKIKIDMIKKIIINTSNGKLVYYHIKEKRKKKESSLLVRLAYNGKIKLYKEKRNFNFPSTTTTSTHSTPAGNLNVTTSSSSTSYDANILYIKREYEKYATNITMAKIGGRTDKSFRKFLSEYFNNCIELKNKLLTEKLTRNDIIEILEFYDSKCYHFEND